MSEIGNQTKEQVNALTRSVAAIAAIAMFASGCSKDPGTGFDFVPELATEALETTPEPTPSATPESAYDPQAMKAVEGYLTSTEGGGHDADDLLLGDDVDQSKNPTEAGAASFTDEKLGVLDSNDELAEFFVLDTEKSQAVRDRLAETYKDNPEELQRVLSGKFHIQVQFEKPVVIEGTTYFVNGKVVKMNSERVVPAGDIVWMYIDSNGDVVPEASIRADCSNLEFTIIRPKTDPKNGLPGIEEVPADQGKGTPDKAGVDEAGQEPDDEGRLPTETLPEPAEESTEEPTEEATEEPTEEAMEEPGTPENPIETKDEDQQEAPAQNAEEDKTSDGTTEDNGGADNTTKPAKP